MNRKDIVLLSPAGSFESLIAAIQGGADAVYFGVEKLNMRARSSQNFTLEDLPKIAEITKSHDVKSYLTLNTVLYDEELETMRQVVDAAVSHQIDAIIAADFACIQYAFSVGMNIHISTQANITNIEGVRFFARFSDVMVLARELNLEQVAKIATAIKKEKITGPSGDLVKIEMFAHGALCMAVSGKCYLSLHQANTSANRGECLQICRRAYEVTDKETADQLLIDNEYIMSPQDLCTITFLDKLVDAGVSVLKIEGRARSPEYVKKVTDTYNNALKALSTNTYSYERSLQWENDLSSVFNRGFWDGYYLGRRLGEWSGKYGSRATKRKVYLGKGTNYFANIKVAEFKLETKKIQEGDEILIIGPTTGVIETTVKEIRVNREKVSFAKKGDSCSIPIDQLVRRSDKLYKLVETSKVGQ